jgi:hypothetical protein
MTIPFDAAVARTFGQELTVVARQQAASKAGTLPLT